jgi:hypothetical protein
MVMPFAHRLLFLYEGRGHSVLVHPVVRLFTGQISVSPIGNHGCKRRAAARDLHAALRPDHGQDDPCRRNPLRGLVQTKKWMAWWFVRNTS